MERKIKFRGKRIDNGEWVYGYYVCYGGAIPTPRHIIHDSDNLNCLIGFNYDVYPATVGQFTGQTDKNGKEIYDGDICNCREYECYGKVAWNDDEAGFYFCIIYEDGMFEEECLYDYVDALEIIGNIHDNPELLEVQQ